MLLAHAITLAEARSYLAALADHTHCLDASEEYDRALLYLDAMHGAVVPALSDIPIDDSEFVYRLAIRAAESLREYGIDPLQVEIVLAMIEDAHRVDQLCRVDANDWDRHDIIDHLNRVACDLFEFDWGGLLEPDVGGERAGGASR